MRLHGLDIARFLAFLGMVLVNFRIAAQVTPGADVYSQLTNALEGRAAALFVVLAGIGLSLGSTDAKQVLRRALFLFAAGLLNLTIFEADILHFYGLYFLLALPFLSAPSRSLLWAAIAVVAIGVLGLFALDYEANWDWNTLAYDNFWTFEGFLRHAFFNGWHPVFPWVAFLFIGMWLGRLTLDRPQMQLRLIAWGSLSALLGALPAQLVQDPELMELLNTGTLPPGPFYVLAASGSAAVVIGLVLLCYPALERLRLSPWLIAPGRQALSLYVAHILLGMGSLEALGLLDGTLSPAGIFWWAVGFCGLSMVFARAWSLMVRQGPLETLMRWTTR